MHIITHVMPWELPELQNIVWQLKNCLHPVYEFEDGQINLDITFNVSSKLFDWDNSKISNEFLVEQYINILQPLVDSKINVISEVEYGDGCLGVNDKRRTSIRKYKNEVDYFLYLDTDMFFPVGTLYTLITYADNISKNSTPYFILSPETIQM